MDSFLGNIQMFLGVDALLSGILHGLPLLLFKAIDTITSIFVNNYKPISNEVNG